MLAAKRVRRSLPVESFSADEPRATLKSAMICALLLWW